MKKSAIDQLMEQAQVFASAWSLVGSTFDKGNLLTVANDEKAALREMLEDFVEQTKAEDDPFVDALLKVQEWHAARVADLVVLQEGAKAGVTLKLGDSDTTDVLITEEFAAGMQLALDVAIKFLGKLPFAMTRNRADGSHG